MLRAGNVRYHNYKRELPTFLPPWNSAQSMTSSHELERLKLRCAQLEHDVEAVRQERNNYRARWADTRQELTELQSKYEDLMCEYGDMKRSNLSIPMEVAPRVRISSPSTSTVPKVEFKPPPETQQTGSGLVDVFEIEDSDIEEVPRVTISTDYSTVKVSSALGWSAPQGVSQAGLSTVTHQVPALEVRIPNKDAKAELVTCSKRRVEEAQDTESSSEQMHKRLKMEPNRDLRKVKSPAKVLSNLGLHPALKIKVDEATVLYPTTVARYLKDIVPLRIEPAPTPILVPHKFLGEVYGAHLVFLLLKRTDGRRSFIFPTQDINPDIPVSPGDPGLLLSSRLDMVGHIWTFFTQVTVKPVKWQYLGEYQCTPVGKLSPDEFSQQRPKVKTSWAEKLRDVDWPAYRQMRARIWLRKTNQNLTEESIEAATEQNNGVVSSDDTLQALEHGDEQIDIVQVVCIKYDHDFAEDM